MHDADLVPDLLAYLDAAPTPYHAVAETARRLEQAGFTRFREEDAWSLEPGTGGYVVRHEGSLIAFRMGAAAPAEAGMRVIGAHTDSPNLRITPAATRAMQGTRQLLIEPYGGLLAYTWFDRDCGLAGRLRLTEDRTVLVRIDEPILRVPSLAIHLDRSIRETGFNPNAQAHLHPLLTLDDGPDWEQTLDRLLAEHDATYREVLAHDLMLHDVTGATLGGADETFVFSGRLDNLASCHAALAALIEGGLTPNRLPATQVIALWDHEEVGSRSASGASGAFLRDVLTRIAGVGEDVRRAIARSRMVSVDMAHGVHPNFPERHDGAHMPKLGRGPVIKWNVNQSYTSDAASGGWFVEACRAAGFEPQHYSHRNDIPCGSTIGPLASAALGMRTVDVGNPMLSMHSCREMAAAGDHAPMVAALAAHLRGGA